MTDRYRWTLALPVVLCLLLSCGQGSMIVDSTGGGTEITNGATIAAVVVDSRGAPVTGAVVRLRREDYLARFPGIFKTRSDLADVYTDSTGSFAITSVPVGGHVLAAAFGNDLAKAIRVRVDGSLAYAGTDTIRLETPGIITGSTPATDVLQSVLIRIAGLEHAIAAQTGSSFTLENVPAGIHTVHVMAGEDGLRVGLVDSVIINPGQEIELGEVALGALDSGMIGYWPFDEASGEIAGDMSGNSLDGIVSGATWVKGRRGSALAFNGVDDSVLIPVTMQPSPAGAISFWIRADSTCLENRRFRVLGNSSQFEIVLTGNTTVIGLANELGVVGANSWGQPNLLYASVWHHVVCNYDVNLTLVQIFVDGRQRLSRSPDLALPAPGPMVFGTRAGTGEFFPGALDEIRIYDKVLTEKEVRLLWLAGNPQ